MPMQTESRNIEETNIALTSAIRRPRTVLVWKRLDG